MAGHPPQPDEADAPAAFDRTGRASRAGSVGWVLLLAAILIAAAAGLFYVGPERSERYIFGLLAVLATAGTFCLFAIAAGILRFSGSESNALLKRALDNAQDAIVITEPGGKVIYANSAYLALTGSTAADVRPVERVFIGDPDVSESIYRLLNAARDGGNFRKKCGSPTARTSRAAGCGCACGRSTRRRNWRCGRSPTSRATASGRRTCFRISSTPSIISITRRPASSPPMPRARWSISTRRWPAGSITISPASAPAAT
jgi:PAS domain-containing protein